MMCGSIGRHPTDVCGCFEYLDSTPIDTWLVVSNIWIIFHFIYGMSSFPLTNSMIFQDVFLTTNQVILPFIVDLPIKNGDFPYHNLPYPMF